MSMTELIDKALEARGQAYAPYSNHPVGAALLLDTGAIYVGANMENAAYPEGVCAEAVALSAMMMDRDTQQQPPKITDIVVAGPGVHLCAPCGGCRQKIREFAGMGDPKVHMVDEKGTLLLTVKFSSLLPHSFGPDNLDALSNQPPTQSPKQSPSNLQNRQKVD